ncbi:hypothetical protein LOH54_01125 [Sulfurimonas sp. HSL-3221]|uniref:hypothetical protein n=1 Tax=Sulfurimonadaceae TaxID=2771471 RepID=UPI001E55EE7C|nr:hypothetical protein [Sulfurimonas sp. HSL-3221]UFS62743.1 hypothetical protein LOH54_01125 [Sulfurimonas sp. HSL-3221]
MGNQFADKKELQAASVDELARQTITRYNKWSEWLSFIDRYLSKPVYYVLVLDYFLILFQWVPILGPYFRQFSLSTYFVGLFAGNPTASLTSMYLLAPLIALYFREQSMIVDGFISDYDMERESSPKRTLLDEKKDDYDVMPNGIKLDKLMANQRFLNEFDDGREIQKFINTAIAAGQKREKIKTVSPRKISVLVGLMIPGMMLSAAVHDSIAFVLSACLLLVIMTNIMAEVIYGLRSYGKSSLFKSATDASHHLMMEAMQENAEKPAVHFIFK